MVAETSSPALPGNGAVVTAAAVESGGRERGQLEELRRLLPYARRHSGLLATTLTVCVVLAVIDIPIPFFLKHLIDSALHKEATVALFGRTFAPGRFLAGIFACMVALALAKGALVFAQRAISETIGQRIVFELRLDLYRRLQSLSMRFFREARTGKLMLRLMGDINAVLDMITDGFLRATMDSITVAAVVLCLFLVNAKLALVVLAAMPIYVAAFVHLNPRLRRTGRQARRERSALSGHLQEKIAGAAIVKAFAQEEAEADRVETQTGRLRDRLIDKARVGGILNAVANTTVALGAAMVLWIGGRDVLSGAMTKGSLMAFYSLSAMLFPPLRRLAKTNESYQAARVSLDRILDFFDNTETHRETDEGVPLHVTSGEVAFDGVSFAYSAGAPVLRDVTLRVRGGETVALVGFNGAGKTTLINMLLKFLRPDAGRVLVDGQDLGVVQIRSLRRQIGVVSQETILFSGTIRDNIRYGKPTATDEEVAAAARVANAEEFILALPGGFDADAGERGQRLSGGQLQRIALARAVLGNPRILILDEATSAVDAESEAAIQNALARVSRGRTTILIAHRASTVRRADRIVVVESGRIVEEGTHDELLARGSVYPRLFADPKTIGRANPAGAL